MFLSSNDTSDIGICANISSSSTVVDDVLFENDSHHNIKLLRSIQRSLTFDEDDVSFVCEQRINNNNNNKNRIELSSLENLRTPVSSSSQEEYVSNEQRCYNRIPYQKAYIQYMEDDPSYNIHSDLFVPSLEMTMVEEYNDNEMNNINNICYISLQPRNATSIFNKVNDNWIEEEEYLEERAKYHPYCKPTMTNFSLRKSYYNNNLMIIG